MPFVKRLVCLQRAIRGMHQLPHGGINHDHVGLIALPQSLAKFAVERRVAPPQVAVPLISRPIGVRCAIHPYWRTTRTVSALLVTGL
jgi:hypothetical protein